jgi:phospholipid/cholesterol/gamma-HCH transport system substrate-binding protein
MENRAHALAAGLFTLLLGIGVLLAAQWFSRDNYEKVQYTLVSKHSVSGLNVQAAVRLRGVEVGKVESIEFDEEDPRNILIKINIKGGTRITRGTTAQLGTQGITGLAYIVLDDDGKNKTFLPPSNDKDKRIALDKSFFDELTGSGKDLISQFGEVAQRVNKLLEDKNQTQLISTIAELENASRRIGSLAQSLEPGMKNVPALTADTRKVLASADVAMRDLAPALKEAKTTLASIDKLAREYTQRADTLDRAAKGVEQVGAASQSAASAVSSDVAPRMNTLLEELARNSRNLDRLLSELNEQPAGLVFGRPSGKPGPGEAGYAEPQKR